MNWKKFFEPTITHLLVFFALFFVAGFIGDWAFTNRFAGWTERAFGISTFLLDWQFWITVPLQPLDAVMWLFNLQKILTTGFLLIVSLLIIVPLISVLHLIWQYWLAGQIASSAKQRNSCSLKKWLQSNQNRILVFLVLFIIGQVLAGLYSLDAIHTINSTTATWSETAHWTFWIRAVLNPVNAIFDLLGVYKLFQFGIVSSLIVAFAHTVGIIWLYLLAGWLLRLQKKQPKTNVD